MSTGQPSSYDELPYGDNFFPYTHPDYLATVARLRGIEAPDVATCRVLELGCAGGGNLIPMAQELPGAQFLGVDLSSRQIDAGRSMVERLGLRNVDLRAISLLDVDESFGTFDYILCHGVYSWVPGPVRDKILELNGRLLAADGVAYLSYNTFPGWHARGMIREMMTFHVRDTTSAVDRVEKARAFLDGLARAIPEPSGAYARIVRTEAEFLRNVANSYLYHEHLEETNHPLYFREMAEMAGLAGLRFLAEARTPGLLENLPGDSRDVIRDWVGEEIEDEIAAEQYLDFLCNRTFRRSLFCRGDRGPLPGFSAEVVSSLWVGSNVVPASTEGPIDARSDAPVEFRRPDGGAGLTTNSPALKTALMALHQVDHHPVAFESLLNLVRAGSDESTDPDVRANLERSLLRCFLSNLVELHIQPPRFAAEVAARPMASPVARLQAEATDRVVNLRRRTVELADFDRVVLRLLDGEKEKAGILSSLMRLVESGDFSLYRGDDPIADLEVVRRVVTNELPPALGRLADLALLVAET